MDTNTMLSLITTTGLTAASQGIIKSFIDTHITPLFKRHSEDKDTSVETEVIISEYLIRSYKDNMIINTIVFRDEPKTLDDLYIPLTLVKNRINEENKYYKVCKDDLGILNESQKILIVDNAGMGKSTISKFIATELINQNKAIPLLIELRKLTKDIGIVEFIQRQINALNRDISKRDLINMIRKGEFTIIFDGYDEVTDENKSFIIDNIKDFIKKADENQFVLTSREESDISGFGEFTRFSIKGLDKNEAYELIKNYDKNGEKSENLINDIENDENLDVIKEFLVNPLLTSLLYKAYTYKGELVYNKIGFYNLVFEALFNDHDKSKGSAYVHPKKSKLDIQDFERVLQHISFSALIKNQNEYSRQELLVYIENAYKYFHITNSRESEFLKDIETAVPLFVKEGLVYRWVHKSFMEYFATLHICFSNDTGNIINKMICSDSIKYYNILDFCFEYRPNLFWHSYIIEFLDEYINLYKEIDINNQEKDVVATEYYFYPKISVNNNLIPYYVVRRNIQTSSGKYNVLMDSKKTFLYYLLINKKVDIFKNRFYQIAYRDQSENKDITLEDIVNGCVAILGHRKKDVIDNDKCLSLLSRLKEEKQSINNDLSLWN